VRLSPVAIASSHSPCLFHQASNPPAEKASQAVNEQGGRVSVLPGGRDRLQNPESVSGVDVDIVADRIQR
jgi:hypothetical protein